MRTYGRVYAEDGSYSWVEVTTDQNGFDDAVYVTTLIQCLKLNYGESPFYANYGIPAQQSVVTRIFPDFYMNQTQAQFAQFFASLIISKINAADANGNPYPAYDVSIVTNSGASIQAVIPV